MIFPEELASHLEAWGPHCGAPLSVYEGHLRKLLEAHAEFLKKRPEPKIPKLNRALATLDIEGTHLDVTESRICELAVVVLYPDGRRTEWCSRF